MQTMLLEEILSTVGEDADEIITLKQTQDFKYMDRFIKEVFRIYPPVPLFERQLQEDVEYGKKSYLTKRSCYSTYIYLIRYIY